MKARVVIPLLLAFVLSASSLHAQDTLVVSERVGKVIDKEECRYFGLFPAVHSFDGIAFFRDGDNVAIENGGVRFMTISREVFNELGIYINDYDAMLWSLREDQSLMALNDRLKPLQDALLIMPIMIWKGSDIKVEVKGTKYHRVIARRGELIWAGERKLIILPKGEYDYAQCDTIAPGDVLSVTWYGGNNAVTGAIIGGLLGGIAGYAMGQSMGTSSNSGYHEPEPVIVVMMSVLGAVSIGAVGALFGALSPRSQRTDIEIPYDYFSILPQLQARMYYRHGLPPEMRWREK